MALARGDGVGDAVATDLGGVVEFETDAGSETGSDHEHMAAELALERTAPGIGECGHHA